MDDDSKQGAKRDDAAPMPPKKPVVGLSPLPLSMLATAQQPSLGLLMRKPSFYFKGAPIVAATTVGLLFMAWAGNVSQNKYLDETPPGSAMPTQIVVIDENPVSGASGSQSSGNGSTSTVPAPPGATTTTGGGIFGQGNGGSTSGSTSVAAPPAPTSRVSSGSATSGSGNAGSSGSSGASGGQALPPARVTPLIPQPSGVGGNSSERASGGATTLNSLPAMRPRSAPPEIVRPSSVQGTAPTGSMGNNSGANTSGNSNQGGLFNPVAPRGYIRIDPVRPTNPLTPAARPSNEARASENNASRAAASGRTAEVVPSLTRSIERQPTGYVYQRRAMAFMEQGDYSRAADDFQSAIAAYQDQIRQNQNVEDARNGIQTCRSGLNLALSRRN